MFNSNIKVCGNPQRTIIISDTFNFNVLLPTSLNNLVEGLAFSSKEAGIDEKFIYNESKSRYELEIPPSKTSLLKEMTTTYDLTILYNGGKQQTLLYNDILHICVKENKVVW